MKNAQQKYWIIGGIGLLVVLFVMHLFAWKWDFSFFNNNVIFNTIRLPRSLAALFCGMLLALSGLLLQILFANPLAGPSILGISSGASLGVAIAVIFGVGTFGIPAASLLGALAYTMILIFSMRFVKSMLSLLLVGIMLSSFTVAIIDFLEIYAHEAKLKYFILWGMGSLQQVGGSDLAVFLVVTLLVILLAVFISKDLTVFSQGEEFAAHLGVNGKKLRWFIIGITSLSVAVTTAFCGPISFVGIAVPNIVRLVFKTSDSRKLMFGCLIFGPALLLLCDGLILLFDNYFVLPINSMTALFGAPFIIWIIFKKLKT